MKNLYKEFLKEEIKNYFENNKDKILKDFSYHSECMLRINNECLPLVKFLDFKNEKILYIKTNKKLDIGYELSDEIYGLKYKTNSWFLTYEC